MISYWKQPKTIYSDDGLTLIIGRYDHLNQSGHGDKALGVHWDNFPLSRNVLSPCVIPEDTRNAILAGLLHQAVIKGDKSVIDSIREAIEFFNT